MNNDVYCRKDIKLTAVEKMVFADHLHREKLSDNIWDLFEEWVERSTAGIEFFYLKAFHEDELIGLGLFLRIGSFDLGTSFSRLRKKEYIRKAVSIISKLSKNCAYISLRNLTTSNLTRPFFYREPGLEETVMAAMLTFLKKAKDADMVIIIDTSTNTVHYQKMGFDIYPSSSEAYFNVARYTDISEYLGEHRSLKKKLKRKSKEIEVEIRPGSVSTTDRRQLQECLDCSIENSRVKLPSQQFFEENIFATDIYNSNKYLHILIRVDGRVIGFHTFQISGSRMGGVLGGFNREYSRRSFAYERVMVASLDYAIKNRIETVQYSLVDNSTKLRLVNALEPCNLFFYSRNPFNRIVFKHTFKFNDIFSLSLLEQR